MVHDTVVRMLGDAPPDIEDEDGITDRSTYQRVVKALVNNAKVDVIRLQALHKSYGI